MRALLLIGVAAVSQAATHYDVKLTVDLNSRVLRGRETIRFDRRAGLLEWQKQAGLKVSKSRSSTVDLSVDATAIKGTAKSNGTHQVEFDYIAEAGRGFRWLPDNAGLFTAFACKRG